MVIDKVRNETVPTLNTTSLTKSEVYFWVFNVSLTSLVYFLIPLVALIVLTCLTLQGLQRHFNNMYGSGVSFVFSYSLNDCPLVGRSVCLLVCPYYFAFLAFTVGFCITGPAKMLYRVISRNRVNLFGSWDWTTDSRNLGNSLSQRKLMNVNFKPKMDIVAQKACKQWL